MKLKDKTYKKFVDYFEKMSKKHDGEEFEIAYSEIQRETGVASITLKKAIQVLENDGVITVNQGRNTRYGKYKYLLNDKEVSLKDSQSFKNKESIEMDDSSIQALLLQQKNMSSMIEQLRQRIRTQEMSMAMILDRLADLEDKIDR